LVTDGDGMTRIAARLMVITARETAARVPGVRVGLSRLPAANTRSDRQAEAGMAGANPAIELTFAADDGQDLRALAEWICSGANCFRSCVVQRRRVSHR